LVKPHAMKQDQRWPRAPNSGTGAIAQHNLPMAHAFFSAAISSMSM
jgi:hypothetical protein